MIADKADSFTYNEALPSLSRVLKEKILHVSSSFALKDEQKLKDRQLQHCLSSATYAIVVNGKVPYISVMGNHINDRSVAVSSRSINMLLKSNISLDYNKRERKLPCGDGELLRSESENDFKLVSAIHKTRLARGVVDPGRLLFAAALLFDEASYYEKALTCFLQATRKTPPERVVDKYFTDEVVCYDRKVERMSKPQLARFMAEREEKRSSLLSGELELQRLRVLLSHAHIVRLSFILSRLDICHTHMLQTFKLCASESETEEMLRYFHAVFVEYQDVSGEEVSLHEKILRGTGGTVAEAHRYILHQLLDREEMGLITHSIDIRVELCNWLGHRYAESLEFERSRHFYEQADMLCQEIRNPTTLERVLAVKKHLRPKDKESSEASRLRSGSVLSSRGPSTSAHTARERMTIASPTTSNMPVHLSKGLLFTQSSVLSGEEVTDVGPGHSLSSFSDVSTRARHDHFLSMESSFKHKEPQSSAESKTAPSTLVRGRSSALSLHQKSLLQSSISSSPSTSFSPRSPPHSDIAPDRGTLLTNKNNNTTPVGLNTVSVSAGTTDTHRARLTATTAMTLADTNARRPGVAKVALSTYSMGSDYDEVERTKRRLDFSLFYKSRKGAKTVLYVPPEMGWGQDDGYHDCSISNSDIDNRQQTSFMKSELSLVAWQRPDDAHSEAGIETVELGSFSDSAETMSKDIVLLKK